MVARVVEEVPAALVVERVTVAAAETGAEPGTADSEIEIEIAEPAAGAEPTKLAPDLAPERSDQMQADNRVPGRRSVKAHTRDDAKA